MNTRILSTIIASVAVGTVTPSFATLVGARASYPLIVYANASGNVSNLTYNATTHLFYISNSSPSSIQFSSSEGVKLITGTKSLSIQAFVDNSGNLIGGTGGNDFVLTGNVTRGTTNYSGVLLTGTVTAFGFLESGATDQYDFRFTPTGGQLYSFFACGDVAVTVTSENSTFADSFAVNFKGKAKGSIGLEDLIAPVCTCPPDITVESQAFANGLPGAYVTFPMPTVTDNCDPNPTVTATPPSGSFFPLPPTGPSTNYTVTVVAQDAAGNTCTCSFIITVQDTLPPEFSDTNNPVIYDDLVHPINLCNDAGQNYATFAFAQPVATDNAIPGTFLASVSAIDENGATIPLTDLGNGQLQGHFPVDVSGSSVITVTADDGRGNTTQHQVAVIVADCEPPSIICPTNQFVECTGGPIFFEEPIVSDNSPGVKFTLTPTNGSILPVGVNTIFALATDRSGNTNQCTFSVIVQDTTPPTISCPTNVTVECGQPTTPSSTGMATATDTCDSSPQVSFTDAVSGDCPQIITRTWKATDSSGNTGTCVQTITIQDTTPPVLVCPPDKQLQCGDSTLPANTGTATATDSCSTNVTVTYTDAAAPANCTGKAGIDRTWKATDACGNSATAVQHITFVDTTAPVITAPADKQLQCSDSTLPANTGTATATDSCSTNVTVTYTDAAAPANCTGKAGIDRTWKATDGCGNSATAVQHITFVDTTAPVITAPADKQLQCGDSTLPANTGTATATDNCSVSVTIAYTDAATPANCTGKAGVDRTWKATDGCGNSATAVQHITFVDTTAPVIASVPAGASLGCNPANPPTDASVKAQVTATDNCGTATVNVTHADATSGCTVTRTFTITATDGCGNVSTPSTVVYTWTADTTAPVIASVPAGGSLGCNPANPPTDASVKAQVTATDNCGTATVNVTHADTTSGCTVTRTFTITATDGCGNVSTPSTVVYAWTADTTAPVLTVPADKQLQCGGSTLPANTGTATATDNCSTGVTITYTDVATPANCTGKPGIARTWKATDGCGNSSTAVQNITFVDTIPPVLARPPITVPCASAVPVPSPTTVTATDNCGGQATVSFVGDVITNQTCPNRFIVLRTYQAVDACGNSNSCTQTITVNDTTGPVITGCVDQAVTFKPISTNCSCKFDFPFDGNRICKGRYIWFNCALQIPSTDNGPCTVRVRQQTIQFACGNSNITLNVPDADVTFSNGAPCATTFTNGAWATMTPWGLNGNTFCAGLAWQAPCDLPSGIDPTWSATFSVDNINVAVNWQAAAAVYSSFNTNHCLLGVKPTDDNQACGYKNSDNAGSPQCYKSYVTCGGRSGDCDGFRYTGCHNPYGCCNIQKGVVKKGPVYYTLPTVSDACGGIAKLICSPPPGTVLGPGVTTVNCIAFDGCGNTNTCSFKLTVLSPCQVVFDSPADDGQMDNHAGWYSGFDDWNCPDDAYTTENFNVFRCGDKVLHTVRLLDCTGVDVTDSLASSVTVHIDVTERQGDYASSTLVTDVPQNYVTVGSPGSIMVWTNHHFEYNLDTTGYESGTINNGKSFRSCVWVEYKTAPGVCAGIEDIYLESQ